LVVILVTLPLLNRITRPHNIALHAMEQAAGLRHRAEPDRRR
jgi:hypothetical protein